MQPSDIGLIGLAVMGQNLVRNMARNGFRVSVFNRTAETTRAFLVGPGKDQPIRATYRIEELVASLQRPRRVMLMVKSGAPVDAIIGQLKTLLEPGDLIIDGGNSFFEDSERRSRELEADRLQFLGTGVSGGEEGALWGPSIMPGGQQEAYRRMEPIFEAIAARVDGEPCVTHIGPKGSGHYVKMVHNAIEYGDMQLIAEAYDLLHRGLGLSATALHETFARWNQGPLSSYLIEITADIFIKTDPQTERPLVDVILDKAGQKGTGRWTGHNALELGVPVPTLQTAVEARSLSAFKDEREAAAGVFPIALGKIECPPETFVDDVETALYAAKICSYAQGMALFRGADQAYGYGLDCGAIARIWRGGCIIRARFLNDIREAYAAQPDLTNLLLAAFFREALLQGHAALRRVVAAAARTGIPAAAFSASLAYFDAYRCARLPANLIQAQRDYFGAHTYQRVDREGAFHTEWTRPRQ